MSRIEREHYHVPRRDRTALIRPEAARLPALVRTNRERLAAMDFEIAGRPPGTFRGAARAEIVRLARDWTARWGVTVLDWSEPMPIVASGHQPPPFHPGVWIKNWLAGSLAEATGGVGLYLTVDNDEAGPGVIRLPTRDLTCRMGGDEVRHAEVVLVPQAGGKPHEEVPIESLDRSAAERVPELAPREEIAEAFASCWAHLEAVADQANTPAEALVAARRRMEEEEGLTNLELPVSAMADSEAFRLFVAELLGRRKDVFKAYNGSLAEYREAYHERSEAQPLPDLGRDGRRVEVPLWAWCEGGVRERLWSERTDDGGLAMTCDHHEIGRLAPEDLADPAACAERQAEWRARGWKIRPRALALTLFVRLAVADVFIHGLGGALYDRITDRIVERLFGARPPEFIRASCTVYLPLATYDVDEDDWRRAHRRVRDWRYNPDRLMPENLLARDDVRELVKRKWDLVGAEKPTPQDRYSAWREIRLINGQLAEMFPEGPREAAEELRRIARRLEYNEILHDREAPICLHPRSDLAAFCRDATRIGAPEAASHKCDR